MSRRQDVEERKKRDKLLELVLLFETGAKLRETMATGGTRHDE